MKKIIERFRQAWWNSLSVRRRLNYHLSKYRRDRDELMSYFPVLGLIASDTGDPTEKDRCFQTIKEVRRRIDHLEGLLRDLDEAERLAELNFRLEELGKHNDPFSWTSML